MNAVLLMAATTLVGIDVGYQPLPEGGVEYIIQIEPQLLDRLAKGEDLESAVPPELDVRRYRITVGNAILPRELPTSSPARPSTGFDPPKRPSLSEPARPLDKSPLDSRPIERTTTLDSSNPLGGARPLEDNPPREENRPLDGSIAGESQPLETVPVESRPFERGRFDRTLSEPDRTSEAPTSRYSSPPITAAPRELEPAPSTNPLSGRPVTYDDPSAAEHQAERPPSLGPESSSASRPSLDRPSLEPPRSEARTSESKTAESKPWMPLLLTTFVLFMSIAANIYLGLIAWSGRLRYQSLLDKLQSAPAA